MSYRVSMNASPFLLCLSAAPVIARWIGPRPRVRPRHLVLLPGTIACAIFLMASAVHMVTTGCTLLIARLAFEDDTWPALAFGSVVTSSIGNGETVASVWATLALTGRWRPVPDWVDRAGRAPGVVMIVAAFGLRGDSLTGGR